MLESYLKKEITRAKEMISSYKDDIDAIKKEMKGIDEKYKKLAEQEKEELSATKDAYDTQLEFWKSRLNVLKNGDDNMVEESAAAIEETVEETPSEIIEEKIVDTIFPENNEGETGDVPQDQGPEFDGAGFTDADNYVGEKDLGDWLESNQDSQEENKADETNDWPDAPQEW